MLESGVEGRESKVDSKESKTDDSLRGELGIDDGAYE